MNFLKRSSLNRLIHFCSTYTVHAIVVNQAIFFKEVNYFYVTVTSYGKIIRGGHL
jgi:hypothetical protein